MEDAEGEVLSLTEESPTSDRFKVGDARGQGSARGCRRSLRKSTKCQGVSIVSYGYVAKIGRITLISLGFMIDIYIYIYIYIMIYLFREMEVSKNMGVSPKTLDGFC